jgi:hypothetical protein
MEDPTTEEMRVIQRRREADELERSESSGDEGEKHERRAERAGYLREKLEERAAAERAAAEEDAEPGEGDDGGPSR